MLNVIRAALGLAFVGIVVLMFTSCVVVAWKPVQTFTSPEEEVAEEEEALPPLTPFDLISEE
jgi:hypothetical protein